MFIIRFSACKQQFYVEVSSTRVCSSQAGGAVYCSVQVKRQYLVVFGDQDSEKTTTQAIRLEPLTSSGCNLHLCHGMVLPVTTLCHSYIIWTTLMLTLKILNSYFSYSIIQYSICRSLCFCFSLCMLLSIVGSRKLRF